ncbi:O-antigen ligase family protein [Alkalimarinus alittae]|uniref:O-antigen ligase family protein n=1 Tax=Alkalimarinus alittae TaxID=2961619 RepID=A0ABY6N0X6_9ALTE|nr:O-antigen ligase family protein [Alkalimarinus alittae]UZE95757.1 O-antigen ligase family protein [Alkalimarinus alittae]
MNLVGFFRDSSLEPRFWSAYLLYSTLIFLVLSINQNYDDLSRAFYFIGVLPAILLLLLNEGNRRVVKQDITFWLIVLLLTSLYLTVYWGREELSGDVIRRYSRWFFITLVFATAMYFYGFHKLNELKVHYYILQLSAAIAAVSAIAIYFAEARYPQRLVGMGLLDHPILGSGVLIMVWVMSLLGANLDNKKDIISTVLSLTAVSFFVFLSQSRGPIIATIILWLGIIWLIKTMKARVLVGFFSTFVALGLYLFLDLGSVIQSMIERGSSYRFDIWSATLSNMNEYFWFGIGVATDFSHTQTGMAVAASVGNIVIDHPHNLFLSMWVYGGIIPVLLLSLVFCYIFFRALQLRGKKRDSVLIIFFTVLALSITDTYKLISSPQEIWLIFWLPIGVLCGYLNAQKRVLV